MQHTDKERSALPHRVVPTALIQQRDTRSAQLLLLSKFKFSNCRWQFAGAADC
jgi:hypothetical protein